MTLNKKERGLTIAVGITIGVVLSWALFSRWQEDRKEFKQNLPGNYDSNLTAHGQPLVIGPPEQIQIRYPKGRVLYHATDANASSTIPGHDAAENIWILTVASGRFKFVRVEQEVSGDANATGVVSLYRGAEMFAWTGPGVSEDDLREALTKERYNVLGKNERLGCYIIQFREISPMGLPSALRALAIHSFVDRVEPCLIK
ncbi:MAG: hypothetical protein VCA36_06025 [Opitutales bacterium]